MLTGSVDDMHGAIETYEEAVKSTLERPVTWIITLNLTVALSLRHIHSGSLNDLNRAVELASQVVAHTSSHNSRRASRLMNLGNVLAEKAKFTSKNDDKQMPLQPSN